MTEKETLKAIEEALEVISDGKEEIKETKRIIYDKKTAQYSVKIPKSLALKSDLDENSEIEIIVNPKEETLRTIKSNIIIFKRGTKEGEGKENT